MLSSFSRRRIAILLALTCLLLITLDRNDNAQISKVRRAFAVLLHPFETAARVVARPVERLWDGVVHADDLRRQNAELRDQIGYQRGATVEAVAAELRWQELERLSGLSLPNKYRVRLAEVIGDAPTNFQNTVEINLGANGGLQPGMMVMTVEGLVGRIRTVKETTSIVLLVTDPDFAVGAQALMRSATQPGPALDTLPPPGTGVPGSGPVGTGTPGTGTPGSGAGAPGTITSTPGTSLDTPSPGTLVTMNSDPPVPGSGVAAVPPVVPATAVPPGGTAPLTTDAPGGPEVVRETGSIRGQTLGKPLRLSFIDDTATSRILRVGALVQTSGGASSLAPPNLLIGTVSRVQRETGGGPPIIEVTPSAKLTQLRFVAVVLYVPNPAALGT